MRLLYRYIDKEILWNDKRGGRSGTVIKHGKSLGGSSMLNGMLYVRGSTRDYQEWDQTWGAHGWGWDDVLPYFKKAQRMHNDEKEASAEEGWFGIHFSARNKSLPFWLVV